MSQLLRKLFSTGSKPCPQPPGMSPISGLAFSIPTSPMIGGKKLFCDNGPGYMDPNWTPPKPTNELPERWFIDENGFYTINLSAVEPTKEHFHEADCEAFPHPLWLYRRAFDRTCHERFKMNAYWVGLRFHHFMGKHIPGFWDMHQYKKAFGDDKVVRLIFEEQCEIIFYGTHSSNSSSENGATLVVIDINSNRRVLDKWELLYQSQSTNRDICYPEHRELKHPAFELPSKETAKAIIQTYAMVAAISQNTVH